MSDSTQYNFTPEEEAKANKNLIILSAVLMLVFLGMGFARVESVLSHYLWFVFAVGSFFGVFVFSLVARKEAAAKAKA